MNNLNWEQEHKRFMTVAYDRTKKAAKRAFWDGTIANALMPSPSASARCGISGQGSFCRGRNPEPMTSALIKYALLCVRYDRKIGGRARNLDVYDFKATMNRQILSDQGKPAPTERSSAENTWINWHVAGWRLSLSAYLRSGRDRHLACPMVRLLRRTDTNEPPVRSTNPSTGGQDGNKM